MIGIILAGGEAARMGGGDKGLAQVGGVPVLDRVVATLRSQCTDILISANGDSARFARYGCPVVADDDATRRGPLAGILAGLDRIARHDPKASFAVSVPTDTPFLPEDLVSRLQKARGTATLSCARSGGRVHPVVVLWPVAVRDDLRTALDIEGLRKMRAVLERHATAYADWPVTPYDPFFNVNTPDDLKIAEAVMQDYRILRDRQILRDRLADPPFHRL